MTKAFVFIIGSIAGSFLNVCIYRLPKNKSIVAPRSYCPNCKTSIRWHDNIPILSYLMLGGRCRACKARISFRYFLVEVLTASLILMLFMAFGLTAKFLAYSVLASGLIIATFVDFEIQEIPDEVTISGLLTALAFSVFSPSIFGETAALRGLFNSFLGGLVGAGSIYLMGILGEFIFKKEAMGGGDVKLMAMIGAFLGWELALLAFFIAPLFGAVVGMIMKIKRGSETIPYGPYLSLGAIIAVFWGERILRPLFYGTY